MPDLLQEAQALRTHNYVICARNIKGGRFGDEPGKPRFLKVPRGGFSDPQYDIGAADWIREVVDHADGIADEVINPKGDVLVFIHGYNNSFQEIAVRHSILQDDLLRSGWRGVVVSYDWPCNDDTLNYWEDREDAADTAQYLVAHGVEIIYQGRKKYDCEINLHLLGHSTGAYVIMEAFAQSQKSGHLFKDPWRIGQVAFIGGDVACDSMQEDSDWGRPMFSRIMRLTNYSNGFDDVLAVSNAKRLGTAPRVGRIGVGPDANPKAVNVDCSGFFEALDPDTQQQKVGWWNHSWHIGNPVWTVDLAMTMEGRYDRNVLPTREKRVDGLHLVKGERPPHEQRWREMVTAYGLANPGVIRDDGEDN